MKAAPPHNHPLLECGVVSEVNATLPWRMRLWWRQSGAERRRVEASFEIIRELWSINMVAGNV